MYRLSKLPGGVADSVWAYLAEVYPVVACLVVCVVVSWFDHLFLEDECVVGMILNQHPERGYPWQPPAIARRTEWPLIFFY